MSVNERHLGSRLVFVVGARRSGTNWLYRILTSHPDVVGIPAETHLFSHGVRPLAERIQHGAPDSPRTGFVWMERQAFIDAVRAFCDRVFAGLIGALGDGRKGLHLVERTPWHAHALDLIGAVYPEARVVHVVRDGRDVARSLAAQEWGPVDLADAAEEWRSTVEAAHHEGRYLHRYVEVRYEELLADARAGITGLFTALDLEADEGTVDAAMVEAGVSFNVDPGSQGIGAGKWRSELSAREIELVERLCGPTLQDLGYPLSKEAEAEVTASASRRRDLWKPLEAFGRRMRRQQVSAAVIEREMLARMDVAQQTIDRFFDAVSRRRFDELAALMDDQAEVRIGVGGAGEVARGNRAHALLAATLGHDEAVAGRQIRGALHTGVPVSTVVADYEVDAGRVVQRTFVFTLGPDAIREVGVYGT